MRFADTNVLLYAASTAPAEAAKKRVALTLLAGHDLALSVQVLQEFYVQATRPTRADRLSHAQASALIEAFLRFRVQEATVAIMTAALETCHRFHISYWDASIIEAARAVGCDTVLSEDLTDGRDYAGVRVQNPFRVRRSIRRS